MKLSRSRLVLKQLINRAALRLGYEVIPTWRLPGREHARHLRHVFQMLGIETAFDVGANAGGFRAFLRREVGFTGDVVSFEPVPSVYAQLVESANADRDTRWRGLQMALGDVDGELPINVCSRTTMSSFLPRDESRLASLGYQHLLNVTDVVRTEGVPVRRLDSILDEALGGRRDARVFLKCDTQGFDLKVIAGAERSLASILALQIELSFKPIYAGAPEYADVLRHMSERGFDVTGVYPVRRDELARVVNFDCVMINSRHVHVADLAARMVIGRMPSMA